MKMNKPLFALMISGVAILSACSDKNNSNDNSLNVQDRNFIATAALSNSAEISAGALAATNGDISGVKMYGTEMVTDHTAAQADLKTVGANANVSVKDSVDATHASLVQQLQGLSGREFDSVYINSQITDHKNAIAAFQQEASSGNRTAVKDYANKYLPKLQMHLQMADSIATANNFKGTTTP